MRAYAIAARAIAELLGTGSALPGDRAAQYGRSLSSQLLRALDTAESSSRRAFAQALESNVDELPIVGRVARDGRRIPLGVQGELLTSTLGRHATAAAVPDTLGSSYSVEITGGSCSICGPLQGPASAGGTPPFHPRCQCEAIPAGVSIGELYAAEEAQL